MKHEQMLAQMDKEEAVFRALNHYGANCFKCTMWREGSDGRWYCTDPGWETECRKRFKKWLQEEK